MNKNNYLDIKQTAKLLNKTQRHIRRMCIAGQLNGATKNGNSWKIPVSADPRLTGIPIPDELSNSQELLNVPANKRNQALKRLGLIREFEKFAGSVIRNNGTRTKALDIFCFQNSLAERTFERWLSCFREFGLLGLVDKRGKGRFITDAISHEAFEYFKSLYLNQRQPTLKSCWQNLCYINRSENKDWNVPGLKFMYKYVEVNIPYPVQVLHREGIAAYEAKCAPYIQVDPDSIEPGQVWVGDHSQFNCWIRHRNQWIRPWITAWQDMRSRNIVGRHISVSPNQTTILLASKDAMEKHCPPDSVKIDNGKDYDSEMWTGTTKARRRALKAGYIDELMVVGVYAMMDIGVSFSIPYHPQSKPIERFFDTMDKQFTKTMLTYCGKDTNRKPDYLADMLKSEKTIINAHDLESFTRLVDKYIEVYNNSAHTGFGMKNMTPNQILSQRQSIRVLPDGVLDLLMRVWSGELTVGKNGIRFKGMWYGQFNMELAVYQSKKVRVAYDPQDLRQVYVYDSATMQLITIAEQNRLISYGSAIDEESLREAMRQKSRAVKIARQFKDSRLTANMDLTSLAIKAMAEGQQEDRGQRMEGRGRKTLRPVSTPLNSQVKEHQRQEAIKLVRKAAGAESIRKVLDIDLSVLNPKKKKEIRLFDD